MKAMTTEPVEMPEPTEEELNTGFGDLLGDGPLSESELHGDSTFDSLKDEE